jgi:hypothetical protein
MRKLFGILLFLFSLSAFSQADRLDSLLNDLVFNPDDPIIIIDKPIKYDFLYIGSNFNPNTYYAGREIGTNMSNISAFLVYYHSTGFFLGTSGLWFDYTSPSYNFSTLFGGFSTAIDKKRQFYLKTSYSRFIYFNPESGISYPYKNNINLGFSFRKKYLGARISSNFLFGDESKINLQSTIYGKFTFLKLRQKIRLYTTPELSAFFSTESVNTTTNLEEFSTKFGLLNTQLTIPVGISIGDFDLEFNYILNFPSTQDVNTIYPINSFYSLSVGYMFSIAKK